MLVCPANRGPMGAVRTPISQGPALRMPTLHARSKLNILHAYAPYPLFVTIARCIRFSIWSDLCCLTLVLARPSACCIPVYQLAVSTMMSRAL